jgi:hypothetical protein
MRVNAIAGWEPLRPALSGLRVRYPAEVPSRMRRHPIDLGHHWQPSAEYRRRRREMREMNRRLKKQPRRFRRFLHSRAPVGTEIVL